MYDNFTEPENRVQNQEIATRIPMDGGFSEEKSQRSGSRYADNQIRDARERKGSGDRGRRGGRGGKRRLLIPAAIFAALALCVGIALVVFCGRNLTERPGEGKTPQNGAQIAAPDGDAGAKDAQAGEADTAVPADPEPAASQARVDLGILESPYAVLIDAESGETLADRRGNEKIFPASMTKILTVLTAIEHIPDLDATIYMAEDYYEDLYEQDASRAGFDPGEEATVRELLYGALLPSGAECCMELARQAAGSEHAFVELMNQKVAALGLAQTHFTNCTGLHDKQQFSTCAEIAELLRAAIQNETFYEVFTTHYYTVGPTNVHPEGFTFWSTLFKNTVDEIVTGGEIIGGKTGYTDEAGHCLASAARLYGKIYILVTAGWAEDPEDEQYHIADAFRAYDALGDVLEQ